MFKSVLCVAALAALTTGLSAQVRPDPYPGWNCAWAENNPRVVMTSNSCNGEARVNAVCMGYVNCTNPNVVQSWNLLVKCPLVARNCRNVDANVCLRVAVVPNIWMYTPDAYDEWLAKQAKEKDNKDKESKSAKSKGDVSFHSFPGLQH